MPLGCRAEHAHLGGAIGDELIDHGGDVELALDVVGILLEPLLEVVLGVGEVVGRETEEVHRHGGLLLQRLILAQVVEDDLTRRHALDLRALNHRGKVLLLVHRADTARYGTILREGEVQVVGHHAVAVGRVVELREVVTDGLVGLGTVEVVGIDDGEGLLHHILGHQHGVVRTPGLHATLRHRATLGQVIELLEDKLHLDLTTETLLREDLAELLLKSVANHKYHLAKAGTNGIVDRIINNGLVVGAYTVHLLQGAVARSHTGS